MKKTTPYALLLMMWTTPLLVPSPIDEANTKICALPAQVATTDPYKFDEYSIPGKSAATVSLSKGSSAASTFEARTAASDNDAEETVSGGEMNLIDVDLELVVDDSEQLVGMRFASVAIPPSANITNAYIQFTAEEQSTGTSSLTIKGQYTDNAPVFTTSPGDISSRNTTTASANWSPPDWNTVDEAGADQRTPDLTVIVQEIVNRAGWSSGNALVIIISGSGERVAYSHDGDPGSAPLLHIEWSGVLPVELVSFDAVADGPAVVLTWATASETNNAGFEIQHSEFDFAYFASPPGWQPIAFVKGHGTTDEAQAYTQSVDNLAPGRHVFRLKQIDFDGSFDYSPEVEVVVEMAEQFVMEPVYPNPFNPEAQFRFAVRRPRAVRVALYDMLGRRVKVLYEGTPQAGQMQVVRIDGRNLPSGCYIVRLQGEAITQAQSVTLTK